MNESFESDTNKENILFPIAVILVGVICVSTMHVSAAVKTVLVSWETFEGQKSDSLCVDIKVEINFN